MCFQEAGDRFCHISKPNDEFRDGLNAQICKLDRLALARVEETFQEAGDRFCHISKANDEFRDGLNAQIGKLDRLALARVEETC
ncbi:hypothetical protein DPMN_156466 [Dreissena polymorpha]|uniref:Uncharacterized protein n=1 Tax=Dreissena polymorpha TaxID=45954 RepID=A0A9D4FQT1_DREPO|nr:hypothetical protein DPMN_156466 [Dreissena polymorpha]